MMAYREGGFAEFSVYPGPVCFPWRKSARKCGPGTTHQGAQLHGYVHASLLRPILAPCFQLRLGDVQERNKRRRNLGDRRASPLWRLMRATYACVKRCVMRMCLIAVYEREILNSEPAHVFTAGNETSRHGSMADRAIRLLQGQADSYRHVRMLTPGLDMAPPLIRLNLGPPPTEGFFYRLHDMLQR